MKRPRWVMPTIIVGGVLVVGLTATAFIFFDHAAYKPTTDLETTWFTGEAPVVAIIALFFAGIAAILTLPAYADWRHQLTRKSEIRISIEASLLNKLGDLKEIAMDGTFRDRASSGPGGHDVFVRVAIHNGGNGPVDGGELNVLAPWGYDLVPHEAADAVLPMHRIPGPVQDARFREGEVSSLVLLAVAADFPPMSTRMFHFVCRNCPPDETFEVHARVNGNELEKPVVARFKVCMEQARGLRDLYRDAEVGPSDG